jgi:hypothetical protein
MFLFKAYRLAKLLKWSNDLLKWKIDPKLISGNLFKHRNRTKKQIKDSEFWNRDKLSTATGLFSIYQKIDQVIHNLMLVLLNCCQYF